VAIADVIERLSTIEGSAPSSDGVVCFARLYLAVTEGVGADVAGGGFADSRFLETLDVHFAGLFFTALESYAADPAKAPSAWVPLFEQRSRRGIAPLQFALAGMNAHINRDLPVALVTTCRELGLDLRDESPEHADFERVDALLAEVENHVKNAYLTGWLAWVDRLTHRLRRIEGDPEGGTFIPFSYLKDHVPPPFSAEWSGGAGRVIHHKFVVTDFNGDSPQVFAGSSNLAAGGEKDNGDNLVCFTDPGIAAEYAIEAIQLVDHYRFRAALQKATDAQPLQLKTRSANWAADYYNPASPRCRERTVLA
jgi:hypothetical protein